MEKEILIETFNFIPGSIELNEDKSSGRLRVKGRFQYEGKENANKRKYKVGTFQRLRESSDIIERLKNRTMLGMPYHPDPQRSSGKTELPEVSHVITNFETLPSGEVVGEAEILNTPNGKILRTLFEDGVGVGISSRGTGSVDKRTNEVQEDYQLETWDFVASPSTYGAYPKPLASVSNYVKEERVGSTQVIQKAFAFISSVDPSKILEDRTLYLNALEHEINLLNLTNLNEQESNQVNKLQSELANMRKQEYLSNNIVQESKEIAGGLFQMNMQNTTMSVNEALLGQENQQIKAHLQSLSESHEDLSKKYDAAVRVIAEMQSRYKQLESLAEGVYQENQAANQLIEGLVAKVKNLQEGVSSDTDLQEAFEKREQAALSLLNAAVGRLKLAESWIEKLAKRNVISERLLEATMSRVRGGIMEAYVDQTLANESEELVQKLKPFLLESTNRTEVDQKFAMFQQLAEAKAGSKKTEQKVNESKENATATPSAQKKRNPLPTSKDKTQAKLNEDKQTVTESNANQSGSAKSPHALALAKQMISNSSGMI